MNTLVRSAGKEDFDHIAELFKQLWPGKSSVRDRLFAVFQKTVEADDHQLLCAERGGRVVGFLSGILMQNFWQEAPIMYITTMIVDERHRRTGIGSLLIGRITEIAREKECPKIELESAFHRSDAHAFYEEMGFEKRAHFYSKDVS